MTESQNQLSIHRLTALWAFSEAGLGGFLHAFKSPFTGLILGSISICLISLICHYSADKWKDLMKALSIVLLIKILVSPHAMITAYFAVAFQGILGALLYQLLGINSLSVALLSILGMIESALQKVVSLTIIFGKSIWEAIDGLGDWIGRNFSIFLPVDSSIVIIGSYVFIYFIFGVILTVFILRLLANVRLGLDDKRFQIELKALAEKEEALEKNGKRKRVKFIFIVVSLALVIGLSLVGLNESPWYSAFYILLRAALILLIWFGFIAPLLMKLMRKYLLKKQSSLGKEVNQTLSIFPYLKQIAKLSWNQAAEKKGISRFQSFFFNCLMYTLHFKEANS